MHAWLHHAMMTCRWKGETFKPRTVEQLDADASQDVVRLLNEGQPYVHVRLRYLAVLGVKLMVVTWGFDDSDHSLCALTGLPASHVPRLDKKTLVGVLRVYCRRMQ